jgi:hypothetical protein
MWCAPPAAFEIGDTALAQARAFSQLFLGQAGSSAEPLQQIPESPWRVL